MKKLICKLLLFIIPVLIYVGVSIFLDPYNVFHTDNIRITYMTPDQNFIKTKYILEHKEKFNAFLFGSSRVANLPLDGLPKTSDDGSKLSWYNMTYAMGGVEENYNTLQTLINGGVDVHEIIIMIDEIAMWKSAGYDEDNLIYIPYQAYEASPLKFYYSYIKQKPNFKLLPQVLDNYLGKNTCVQGKENFYSYGVDARNMDLTYGQGQAPEYGSERSLEYSEGSHAIEYLGKLVELCEEKNIKLYVVTTPIYEETYREGVQNGYLDFLKDAAEVTDFYLFSGINTYTISGNYYFDASHFRPYVGLQMEKIIFGNKDEAKKAIKEAANSMSKVSFGQVVTRDNILDTLDDLQKELE